MRNGKVEFIARKNGKVEVVVQPGPKNTGIDIVLVLDTSGSMDSRCIENATDKFGQVSRLDALKYIVQVLCKTMRKEDRVGVVQFSQGASTVSEFSNEFERVSAQVNGVTAGGCTDLCAGIEKGYSLFEKLGDDPHRVRCLFVLTDGDETEVPRGGTLAHIVPLRSKMPWVLEYYVGLSDQTNVGVLSGLSGQDGLYNFIFDMNSAMTVVANIFATLITTSKAHINGIANGKQLRVPLHSSEHVRSFILPCAEDLQVLSCTMAERGMSAAPNGVASSAEVRQMVIDLCNTLISKGQDGWAVKMAEQVQQCYAELQRHTDLDIARSLADDLVSTVDRLGQVGKAVQSRPVWQKWGLRYLPCYRDALVAEYPLNFYSAVAKTFENSTFQAYLEKITTAAAQTALVTRNVQIDRPIESMYNAHCGCFAETALIEMASGECKPIAALKKGDRLGGGGCVICVIKTTGGPIALTNVAGLVLTPWHPVEYQGKWVFPAEVGVDAGTADVVYNLVLDSVHVVRANGIAAVTLGHNFTDAVRQHNFFGTDACIAPLRSLPGWSLGFVALSGSPKRGTDGLVNAWE